MLDLDYLEDVEAHTDANFVLTGSGKFVEIQGTAEQEPFSRDELAALMALAESGINQLTERRRLPSVGSIARLKRGEKLLIATHNAGKLAEFRELFTPLGLGADFGRRSPSRRAR